MWELVGDPDLSDYPEEEHRPEQPEDKKPRLPLILTGALLTGALGLCGMGYKNKVVAEHVNKEAEKISKNINHQPQNMEEKVNHVSPKRMNKYGPFKDKIKSSLLMGLISSLAAVSEDSLDIKELNKLLSDKYLTKEQQQQVQELINQIKKKKSKKKSLKKKNN